ncbi:hypothetical protein PCA20602_02702 [Pandoraea capi]|uniref:Uncharacterized protein n=1 Tax=Pandoraea capi TaxID=2508286 RepID=A0ABY6W2Y7_9BURK|nr:hypothetical protein [Pandoraea capi]VVE12408.1 hypothetical protein PCA20602_02702 [Pandoraea capi]
MNSRQRRRAYRALPKPGTKLIFNAKVGVRLVTVVGKSAPVIELGGCPAAYSYAGTRPSLRRVKCNWAGSNGATVTPHISRLRAA